MDEVTILELINIDNHFIENSCFEGDSDDDKDNNNNNNNVNNNNNDINNNNNDDDDINKNDVNEKNVQNENSSSSAMFNLNIVLNNGSDLDLGINMNNNESNNNNANNNNNNCNNGMNNNKNIVKFDLPSIENKSGKSSSMLAPPKRTKSHYDKKKSKIIISKLAKLPPPVRRRYTLFLAMGLEKLNNVYFRLLHQTLYGKLFMPLAVLLFPVCVITALMASSDKLIYISSFGLLFLYLTFYFMIFGGFNADVCRILIGTFDFWYVVAQVFISLIASLFYVKFDIRCVGLVALHLSAANLTIFFDAWPPASGLMKYARSFALVLLSATQIFFIICVYFDLFHNIDPYSYTIGFVKYDVPSLLILSNSVWIIFNIRYAIFTFYYPTSFGMYRHRVVSPTLSHSKKARGSLIVSKLASSSKEGSIKKELPNSFKAYPLLFDPTSITQVTLRSSDTICRALFGRQASIMLWTFYKHRFVARFLPFITAFASAGYIFGSAITNYYFYYIFILPCCIIASICVTILLLLSNYSLYRKVMTCFSTAYLFVQLVILCVCLFDMFAWNKFSIIVLPIFLNGYLAILIDCLPIFHVLFAKMLVFGGLVCCFAVIFLTHFEFYNFQRDRQLPEPRDDGSESYTSGLAVAAGFSFLAYLLRSIVNLRSDPCAFITLTSRVISPLLIPRSDLPKNFVYR